MYHLHRSQTETAVVTEASVLHVKDREYFHCSRKWPSRGWIVTNLFPGYLLSTGHPPLERRLPQHVRIKSF